MLEIGHIYHLEMVKSVPFGVYLDAENLGNILLPKRYVPQGLTVGDSLDVFLYLDSEDRLVATTAQPKVQVGQFAYLPLVENTPVGAFLDWGLGKDLLVPFAEQHRDMEHGKSYLVYVYIDSNDGRIVASSKIDRFIDDEKSSDFKPGEPVQLIIANSTDLGFKAIINDSHWGLINKDEVYQQLSFGQSIEGFIQQVRADGRINLTLNGGHQSRDKDSRTLMKYLKRKNGFAPLHDKSDPNIISAELNMSKGAFKKAIGNLYRQRLLLIEKEGIRMVNHE